MMPLSSRRASARKPAVLMALVATVGMLSACQSQGLEQTYADWTVATGGKPPDGSVLASADANLEIILESNKDTTAFSIDGNPVGAGKYLKVWINDNQDHTVVAKPDLCDAKQDVIHPPYQRDARIGFYYLRQDCPGECFPGMRCPSQPAPPVTNAPPRRSRT